MKVQYFLLLFYSSFLWAQSGWMESSLAEKQAIRCFAEDTLSNIYLSTSAALYKSADKGMTWEIISTFPDNNLYAFTITGQNTLIAGTEDKLYRSENFGQQWDSVLSHQGNKIISIKDTCYVNTGFQIYHSHDDGITWAPSSSFDESEYEMREMATGPHGEIYVAASFIMTSAYAAIYLSTDGGVNFVERGVFYELLPGTIAVNSTGTVFASEFISHDMGKTWDVFFNKEDVDGKFHINSQDMLFLSSYSNGLFEYSEKDSLWNQILSIPSQENITATFIDSRDYIYVGTDSGTVYRSAIPTSIHNNAPVKPVSFILYPNYPNPFNPNTVIRYEVKFKTNIKLTVHDILGRKVKVLVNGEQGVGRHAVSFDASALPSGIYIYKLTAGSLTQSRKMLLVK